MKKTIKVTTINDEQTIEFITNAIYNDNYTEVKYLEEDKLKTKVTYHFKDHIFNRNNKELSLEYKWIEKEKTSGQIFVKDIDKSLDVEIYTNKLVSQNGNIEVEFFIEKQKIIYKIEVLS